MLWLIGHGPEEGPEGPCFLTCRATREGVNVGRGQVWGRRGSLGCVGWLRGTCTGRVQWADGVCVKPGKAWAGDSLGVIGSSEASSWAGVRPSAVE